MSNGHPFRRYQHDGGRAGGFASQEPYSVVGFIAFETPKNWGAAEVIAAIDFVLAPNGGSVYV